MLRYVYDQHDTVAHFVAQMTPHSRQRGFGKCKAIGVVDARNELIAGIVYNNWDPEHGVIEISGAALPGTRWLTRETIARMHEYPFVRCGVQMVVMRTPADNERLLRQLASGGYMFVNVPRMFGRDRDGVLCLFTDDDWRTCRFIKHRPEVIEEAA